MSLVFLFLFVETLAIISSNSFSLNPGSLTSFVWFGFNKGGEITLSINVTINGNNTSGFDLIFYLCTPSQYVSLSSVFGENYCLPNSSYTVDCDYKQELYSQFSQSSWTITQTMTRYILYNFILGNCSPISVNLQVNYELINPGGEQLSSGVFEIKYIMIGCFVA